MILAGDVGGTKVHLELYCFADGRLQPVRDEKFAAHQFASLDDVVKKFLGAGTEKTDEIVAACFGCPGPVRDGRLKLTNLSVPTVMILSMVHITRFLNMMNSLQTSQRRLKSLRDRS